MRPAFGILAVACAATDEPGVGPDPCLHPGNICTWMGVPGEAGKAPEGLHRLESTLYLPVDVTFAPDGTAYLPDYNNHRIRKVDSDGVVTTVSGTGFLGDGPNVQGSVVNCFGGCDSAKFAWNHPTDVVPDPADPDVLWVAAWHNSRINSIDLVEQTTSWVVGAGGRDYADPSSEDLDADGFADGDKNGDGSVLDEASLDLPSSLAFGPDGSLYFSDQANQLIRRITPYGDIEDVAGSPTHRGWGGDGGPASAALLHGPDDGQVDLGSKLLVAGHRLVVADTVNGVIRAIDLDTETIDTIAGVHESVGTATCFDWSTQQYYECDAGAVAGALDGPVEQAVFNTPRDVAVGLDGEIYVAEPKNNCVRVIRDDQVSAFAGSCSTRGKEGFAGDGGPATEAELAEPYGVAVDALGNVYIADTLNQVIRRVQR